MTKQVSIAIYTPPKKKQAWLIIQAIYENYAREMNQIAY